MHNTPYMTLQTTIHTHTHTHDVHITHTNTLIHTIHTNQLLEGVAPKANQPNPAETSPDTPAQPVPEFDVFEEAELLVRPRRCYICKVDCRVFARNGSCICTNRVPYLPVKRMTNIYQIPKVFLYWCTHAKTYTLSLHTQIHFNKLHFFYDSLCPTCASTSYLKRTQVSDLECVYAYM